MPKLKTHAEYMKDLVHKNDSYKNKEFEVVGTYKNKSSKILLKNKYGYCIVTANNLLKNTTLTLRSALHPNEYLKEMFREVHGYRYSYELVDFKDAHKKLEIICHKHGIFLKNSNKHLCGEGCPKCKFNEILYINKTVHTGWTHTNWLNASKISKNFDSFKMYIVRLYNEKENFIKVGRTYTTIKDRMKHIPYKYEVLEVREIDSIETIRLEASLKIELKSIKYEPEKYFGGYRECYKIEAVEKALNHTLTYSPTSNLG